VVPLEFSDGHQEKLTLEGMSQESQHNIIGRFLQVTTRFYRGLKDVIFPKG